MSQEVFFRLLNSFREEWKQNSTFPPLKLIVWAKGADNKRLPVERNNFIPVTEVCLPAKIEDREQWQNLNLMGGISEDRIVHFETAIAGFDAGGANGAIDQFKELCNEAGSALPPSLRNSLGEDNGYCPKDIGEAACWWIAVLINQAQLWVPWTPDPRSEIELLIERPHQASIDAITAHRLDTDAPISCLSRDELPGTSDAHSPPVALLTVEKFIELLDLRLPQRKPKGKRGGQPKYDHNQDQRIADAWATRRYKVYADLAAELKCTKKDVELTIGRVRKR